MCLVIPDPSYFPFIVRCEFVRVIGGAIWERMFFRGKKKDCRQRRVRGYSFLFSYPTAIYVVALFGYMGAVPPYYVPGVGVG